MYGDDTPLQIAEYARASGVTKIVLGRSNNKRFFWERSKNLVDRLNALAPIWTSTSSRTPTPPTGRRRKSWNLSERFTVRTRCAPLVILAVCTMVGLALRLSGLQRGQHHHDLPVGRAGGGHGHQRAAL